MEKNEEVPKLDYWMLDVLKEAMGFYSRAKQPFVSDGSLRGTTVHKFTELGKVELVKERLQDIHSAYDEMIKKGLTT